MSRRQQRPRRVSEYRTEYRMVVEWEEEDSDASDDEDVELLRFRRNGRWRRQVETVYTDIEDEIERRLTRDEKYELFRDQFVLEHTNRDGQELEYSIESRTVEIDTQPRPRRQH